MNELIVWAQMMSWPASWVKHATVPIASISGQVWWERETDSRKVITQY